MDSTRYCLLMSLLVWVTPAFADSPFSFDATPGKLPKDVIPLSYTVHITPNAEALTFTGRESVDLRFNSATSRIVFNTLNESLRDVRFDGEPVKSVASNDDQQLTTLELRGSGKVGRHRLTFGYRGKIETTPHGLFVQHYEKPGGGQGVMLTTQMEPTDARRLLPCWDEPAFRASFSLTVTIPSDWTAVANMPVTSRTVQGKLATVTFERSPRMPSYLVELSAGELRALTGQSAGTQLAVWAVSGREQDGRAALENAQQILSDYNDYFGYRYPLPKLDSIAIPGGFPGAMENWGAITYSAQTLLLAPQSTIDDRQLIYAVQAHEMAHQWNGDLVTMAWWDDLWLNESFASWMSAKETALRNPGWRWWEVQDGDKEGAMKADARGSSHAIQQHVADELQANSTFDSEITYSKGQAVLRMFENYLGADTFRDGIRRYMQARALSNATSADLWNALSAASGQDIGAIAAGWTEHPGFPLVTVSASCSANGERKVSLSESRFLLGGTDSGVSRWTIPLQVRSGIDGKPQSVLLRQDGQTLAAGACDQPLSLNSDAVGFYRVKYDAATLSTNTREFERLPAGDRIALLDDQWALVESGGEPLRSYLALAELMGGDRDPRAWQQVMGALELIEFDERGTGGHTAFLAYARSIVAPIARQLGWDVAAGDTPDIQKLRRSLLIDLGVWGDPDVVNEARRRFDAFVKDRSALDPEQQSIVLPIVAHSADAATFEQLHVIAKDAKDEAAMERFYSPLVWVSDVQLADRAAQIALSPELPPQATELRLRLIANLTRTHPALAWQTFSSHADTLLAPYTDGAPVFIATEVPGIFWNAVPIDQLEAWIRGHVPAEMGPYIARGLESARFSLAEKNTLVATADKYVASRVAAK